MGETQTDVDRALHSLGGASLKYRSFATRQPLHPMLACPVPAPPNVPAPNVPAPVLSAPVLSEPAPDAARDAGFVLLDAALGWLPLSAMAAPGSTFSSGVPQPALAPALAPAPQPPSGARPAAPLAGLFHTLAGSHAACRVAG